MVNYFLVFLKCIYIGKIPGRINEQRFVDYWLVELNPSREFKRLLLHGYAPHLTEWPPASDLRNNKSASDPDVQEFLDAEIVEWERIGAIKRLNYKPHCVVPLSVIKREGKDPRAVVDLSRQANIFIDVTR